MSATIVQYPAHVLLRTKEAELRILCVDGVSVRAATETALTAAQLAGKTRATILRVDGSSWSCAIPMAISLVQLGGN